MAQIPLSIVDTVRAIRRRVGSELAVKKIVLFGSYAKGNYSDTSDIDVCIVADNVENNYLATLKAASQVVDIDTRIEPIVVSEQEYNERDVFGVLKEIKMYGVEIV